MTDDAYIYTVTHSEWVPRENQWRKVIARFTGREETEDYVRRIRGAARWNKGRVTLPVVAADPLPHPLDMAPPESREPRPVWATELPVLDMSQGEPILLVNSDHPSECQLTPRGLAEVAKWMVAEYSSDLEDCAVCGVLGEDDVYSDVCPVHRGIAEGFDKTEQAIRKALEEMGT